ncbi:VanW family protein [Clostridium bornimense]|uniref:VanW family protein n=1 Tax=Clostridium bornimense TaxID=1216932 RepID=W6RSY2_9CLOT|nr:VanW family protein [Clostridium bornimense]CDM67353.1 VanW family protein [Clostridium bornimense]
MKNKKVWVISAASLAGIIVVVGIFTAYIFSRVNKYNLLVYPKIKVHGVEIGGESKEEAKKILNEYFSNEINKKIIKIKVGDKEYNLKSEDVDVQVSIDDTVEEAYEYGKSGSTIDKYKNLKKEKEYPIKVTFDENKVNEYLSTIEKEVNKDATDATIELKNGQFITKSGADGSKLNIDKLSKDVTEELSSDKFDGEVVIEAEVEAVKPTIKEEDLKTINTKISSFSTNFGTSVDGRVTNIKLATAAINGKVVMPGEEFSYNEVVGDTTADRGYQKAGTYVGNKVVEGYGGGICQVSSTLYNAIMGANIRSTERLNHNMPVSYVGIGCDATIAYGYIDYKFKNTLKHPIYISSYTSGSILTFDIYCNESDYDPSTTYKLRGEQTGQRNGDKYTVNSYLDTYKDGVLVDSEYISTDTYRDHE